MAPLAPPLRLFPAFPGGKRLGDVERWAAEFGFPTLLGTDEAGRGPLAGPVVAAAVCFPVDISIPGLDDSKKLGPETREALFPLIRREALAWGAAFSSAGEIDTINILRASLDAMARAVLLAEHRGAHAPLIVVDGNQPLPLDRPQETVVGGDALSLCVAAASVIAKVLRDRWMEHAALRYPGYGFEVHKGYPTALHRTRLQELGPCALHRRSFRGVLFERKTDR